MITDDITCPACKVVFNCCDVVDREQLEKANKEIHRLKAELKAVKGLPLTVEEYLLVG